MNSELLRRGAWVIVEGDQSKYVAIELYSPGAGTASFEAGIRRNLVYHKVVLLDPVAHNHRLGDRTDLRPCPEPPTPGLGHAGSFKLVWKEGSIVIAGPATGAETEHTFDLCSGNDVIIKVNGYLEPASVDLARCTHGTPVQYTHWSCCGANSLTAACRSPEPDVTRCCVTRVLDQGREFALWGDREGKHDVCSCVRCEAFGTPGFTRTEAHGEERICFACVRNQEDDEKEVQYKGPLHEHAMKFVRGGSEHVECDVCGQMRHARAFKFQCQECPDFFMCVECASGHRGTLLWSGSCRLNSFEPGLSVCKHPERHNNTTHKPHFTCCGGDVLTPSCATVRRCLERSMPAANYRLGILRHLVDEQLLNHDHTRVRLGTRVFTYGDPVSSWFEAAVQLALFRSRLEPRDAPEFDLEPILCSVFNEAAFMAELSEVTDFLAGSNLARLQDTLEKFQGRL